MEANQIQVSSLIVLTHVEDTSTKRQQEMISDLKTHNPLSKIVTIDELEVLLLPALQPSENTAQKLDHLKAHWASCSADLPCLPNTDSIYTICNALPESILRVKGAVKIGSEDAYTYFERAPDGAVSIRPFRGEATTSAKLLGVGPGSKVEVLNQAIEKGLNLTVMA